MMKFKHDKLVRAWLDGKDIQEKISGDIWLTYRNVKQADTVPVFDINIEYRLKPETVRYRLALLRHLQHEDYTVTAIKTTSDMWQIEQEGHFVRWLTDWVEVEI